MADLEISNLPPVVLPLPTDELAMVNDLVTKKITRAQIHSLELGEIFMLPNGNDASNPEIQFPNSGIYEDLVNELSFSQGAVKVGNLTTPALGGMFVNNLATGSGLERVLTISDIGSFGEYRTTFDATVGTFPVTSFQGDWFNCTVAGTVGGQAFIVGDILIALIDNPSTSVFASNWSIVPHIGVITLAGLSDVDLTGQANNDLLFRSGGLWVDTAGALTWDGSHLRLPQFNDAVTPTLAFGDGDTGFYESADNVLECSINGATLFNVQAGFIVRGTGSFHPALRSITASNTVPTVLPRRNDIDTGIGGGTGDNMSLICGGVQVANLTELAGVVQLIVPLQNNAAAPSIAFGDGDSGFYESNDDTINFVTAGFDRFVLSGNSLSGAIADGPALINENASATNPTIIPEKGDLDTGIGTAGLDQLSLIAGGAELLRLTEATENKLRASAPLYFAEQAAAFADVAGDGQFWVRNDTPNTPMFTDDAGADQIIDPSISEINTQNGNYTLVLSDKGKTIYKITGGAGETYTIPANASVAYPIGTWIAFDNDGGDNLTIAITSDQLLGTDSVFGSRTLGNDQLAVIHKIGATRWRYAASDL